LLPVKEEIPKWALILVTPKKFNPILPCPTASLTVNSLFHLTIPFHKNTLIFFLSLHWILRERKKINDALLPLRRLMDDDRYERHDGKLRGRPFMLGT